jgi:preprotein translocase subunit SecD
MNRSIRHFFISEFMLWVLIGIVALYCIWPLREKIRLGIDLVGGTYLTLQVDAKKAIESDLISKLQAIDGMLTYAHAKVPKEKVVLQDTLLLTFPDGASCQKAAQIIKKEWNDVTISTKDIELSIKHTKAIADRLIDDAVQRNVEVLRTRLDKFSVAEIPISRQGTDRISVELPDVKDPEQAKQLIGRTAALDFRIVYKIAGSEEDMLFDLEGEVPYDREILPGDQSGSGHVYYLVEKYPQVTGNMLKKARPGLGGQLGSEPVVQFEFDSEGGEKFYKLTSENYGKQLAIVLDGEVISAPRISVAIRNTGVIQGNFQPEETRSLALLLQSGSFVAPVSIVEERQIGPSLGEAAIRSGMLSILVGLGLLFLFSLIIYRLSGFLAFLALLYNLLLLLAGLVWIQATLTLPGIAGILLTIGMAIDASILIFEQIREEIRQGITARVAVQKGFSDAMTVILDANITTFLVGVVLYNVGSGPVQGFAVTLMIGIVATLVSALMFLRSIFALRARFSSLQRLSI